MRIRTIKPTFFLHADLFDGEKETGLPLRVAYAGIWCACDREGRFKWEPRRLGVSILPYDGLDFSRVLDALTTRGFLVKYRVGDAWFGAVPSWKRHQFINNREFPSIIPNPSEGQGVDATATRDPRVIHACQGEGKGMEGNGREGKGTPLPPEGVVAPIPLTLPPEFNPPIPSALDTPAFQDAWRFWLGHLKQKKKSPTANAQILQLAKLEKFGLAKAIETLQMCVEKNWRGVYEDRQAGQLGASRAFAHEQGGGIKGKSLT